MLQHVSYLRYRIPFGIVPQQDIRHQLHVHSQNTIHRPHFAPLILLALILFLTLSTTLYAQDTPPPNIILIFADDLGYGDISPYNEAVTDTPNLQKLADQGVQLTDFYVSASVCTPSRAGLLTGRHPIRTHTVFVLGPDDFLGLEPWEYTLGEALQAEGYHTGIVGKWHLGDDPQYLPTSQGFDSFFGIPYSNDSSRFHLMRDTAVIDSTPDQRHLITQFTDEAKNFISQQRQTDAPFFLYMPHSAPHVPLYVPDEFARPDTHTLYQDVIHSLDWSIGQVVDHVDQLGITDNTIIIFTSDNGPAVALQERINNALDANGQLIPSETLPPAIRQDNLTDQYGRSRWAGGQTGDFRGGKGTVYEGGVRMPFIIRWPAGLDTIPEGGRIVSEPASSQDLYDTFLTLAGSSLREDRPYDTQSSLDIWRGQPAPPNRPLFFINGADWTPSAMRMGQWKLHLTADGQPTALYDLNTTDGQQEQENVMSQHPDVTEQLRQTAAAFSQDAHDRPWYQQTAVRLNRTNRFYLWILPLFPLLLLAAFIYRRRRPNFAQLP